MSFFFKEMVQWFDDILLHLLSTLKQDFCKVATKNLIKRINLKFSIFIMRSSASVQCKYKWISFFDSLKPLCSFLFSGKYYLAQIIWKHLAFCSSLKRGPKKREVTVCSECVRNIIKDGNFSQEGDL